MDTSLGVCTFPIAEKTICRRGRVILPQTGVILVGYSAPVLDYAQNTKKTPE